MTNAEWRLFLQISRQVLGRGAIHSWGSDSWCAWTTFASLENHVTYWTSGLPEENELLDDRTTDGGLWMQSFSYADLAHIIIPSTFSWERVDNGFQNGQKKQNTALLSQKLEEHNIKHRRTELVLEIKLF
jgi:hypothetical protein